MANKILQSIIEITRQRDLDSLEYSLVAALAEMVPVKTVSIYKRLDEDNADAVEEVVQLSITSDEDNEQIYTWGPTPVIIDVGQQLKDCLQSPAPLTYDMDNDLIRLLVPIVCDGNIIGALSLSSSENISSYATLIEAFVRIYSNYLIVFNESERDKLTGLYNRRTYDSKLRRLFVSQKHRQEQRVAFLDVNERRQKTTENHTWLAIFDIDNFKQINDNFGHVFGDEVLLTISQITKACFRNSDLLFRVGGEEFVVVLEPVTYGAANKIFDNFRESIASHNFSQIGRVTISIGYAKITGKDFPPEILERADKALYYAKEHGRNCIYNYEELIKEGRLEPPRISGSIDLF